MTKPTVMQVALRMGDVTFTAPRPARHATLMYELYMMFGDRAGHIGPRDQGFLLSDGTFAGRFRAAQVAWEAKQVTKLIAGPDLYSEDLW